MKRKGTPSPLNLFPQLSTLPNEPYTALINSLIKKKPAALSATAVKKWKGMDSSTPQGQIVNEIADKFNNNASTGIQNVKYIKAAGQNNYYEGANQSGNTVLTLAPPPYGKVLEGPHPISVAHELVHANDHQSKLPIDRLTPAVWQNLRVLATTGGTPGVGNIPTPMNNFTDFESSIGHIQHKIAPNGEFKPDPNFAGSGYSFGQPYIEHELTGNTGTPYKTLFNGQANNTPNWIQLFTDINNAVNTQNPSSTVANPLPPNKGFYLNRASEFPAYMSERLTQPWGLKKNIAPQGQPSNALSLPEARFVYSTLGNMDTAYPPANYPTMNQFIHQRRNSIADAYYPPQAGGTPGSGVPQTGFSYGGRVKAKQKRSGLFRYF